MRCYGYRADDGTTAFCTRSELAGGLKAAGQSGAYRHRVRGACGCGLEHSPAPASANAPQRINRTVYSLPGGFEHVRDEFLGRSKSYWWRRDGKKGLRGYPVADLPLYGIDKLPEGGPVVVTEGEKAADALIQQGIAAVGTVCGAKSTPSDAALSPIRAYDVLLWPDNDDDGRGHMERIAQRLIGLGCTARVVGWPDAPAKGDAADVGGGADALRGLLDTASVYDPEPPSSNGANPSGPPSLFPRTDAGNGELFAHLYADDLRFDWRRGQWVRWAGHFWANDDVGLVKQRAKATARRRYQNAIHIYDLREREAEAKWAILSESRGKLEAMLALAQAEDPLAVPGDAWDKDPMLLGAANGVVKLQDGSTRPGRQGDNLMLHSPVRYNPDAPYPRWERFLDEVFDGDQELIHFIHKAVGYSLTGDTSEQCWFLCHGRGSNGKSTFLSMIAQVMGGYAQTLPFATLSFQERPAIPNDLAALVGVRFVTTIESGEAAWLNEERIKGLVGEDKVRARFLHGEFFEFQPVLKLWLAVNHKPLVRDESDGFWRKVRLIPFTQRFSLDRTLRPQLRAEAEGILAWAILGCKLWQGEGLGHIPEKVQLATDNFREESDLLAEFLADNCTTGEGQEVRAKVFYEAYKTWGEANHLTKRETLTNTAFGRKMGERFTKVPKEFGTVYLGVGLRGTNHGGSGGLESSSHVFSDSHIDTRDNMGKMKNPPAQVQKHTRNSPESTAKRPSSCRCGSVDFWQRPTGEWVYQRCQPDPRRNP